MPALAPTHTLANRWGQPVASVTPRSLPDRRYLLLELSRIIYCPAHALLSLCMGPACQPRLRPRLAPRPWSLVGWPRLSTARPTSQPESFPRTVSSPTCQALSPSTSSARHGRPSEHKPPSPLLRPRAPTSANHPAPSSLLWLLSSPADHRRSRHWSTVPSVAEPPKLLGPHAPVVVSKTSDGYACAPDNLTGSVRVLQRPRINHLQPGPQD
jgi:hypothetical protein